jgi:nitroimidazol reductase NimA-like FMN-containing flavoprotein (pyridoxamine 5'-phosphate oxidase superfamily)/GNAT superfamily N-acetyltransferase
MVRREVVMLRRVDKAWSASEAWNLLDRSAVAHLGGAAPDGAPIVRPIHPVVRGDAVWFHGAPEGEKLDLVGQPVQLTAHEIVAEVPSYAFHPERACPATTFYTSVSARGLLVRLDDPVEKAAVLQGLMTRMQPEGGHAPVHADDPRYRNALAGISVLGLVRPEVVGKSALGQRYTPAVRGQVLQALWRRGSPDDLRAIDRIVEAAPPDPWPAFLRGADGVRFRYDASAAARDDLLELLAAQYWNEGVSGERIVAAARASAAWVGAWHGDRLIGTARAISDGAKLAYLMDVAVHPAHQRRGVGGAMVDRLLDHPAVRGARRVELHTRDAAPLYASRGFGLTPSPAWRIAMRYDRA